MPYMAALLIQYRLIEQDGTRAILKAMQKLKKNTFIAVTSAILREPGLKELPW